MAPLVTSLWLSADISLSSTDLELPPWIPPWLRSDLIIGVTALVITIILSLVIRSVVTRALSRRDSIKPVGVQIGRFGGLVVFVLGLLYSLMLAGVQVGPLLGAFGVGGVAVAFAAQDILSNLVAGFMIQVRRPFRVGDQVSVVDYEGTVRDIDLRVVRLHTYDGLDVLLPNAKVLTNPITNHTKTPFRRTTLPVGVAYDTDLELARDLMLEVMKTTTGVSQAPPPTAWVTEFGDNAITINAMYWHRSDMASLLRVRNNLAIALKKRFDEHNIEIAFPQRTVWLKREQ